jgi:predicted esterase
VLSRDIAPGVLVERIVCSESQDHSYALYAPARYDPAKRWPILYVLDPRGRATVAAQVFQRAAERFGYIVASSYDSASDSFADPNLPAMQAMWRDTHALLSIDDRRVYAAGFSGTARAAFHMGLTAPHAFAGIVAAGGGFPPHEPPTRAVDFVVFGTAGVLDFNYDEMNDLAARLTTLGVANRLEAFEGTHQWPPEELAERALAWMEIQAMRAGLRERSSELIDEVWSSDLERARKLASTGKRVDSRNLYASLLDDFPGLHDLTVAEREIAELVRDRSLKKEESRRKARRERDDRYVASAGDVFARLRLESPVPGVQSLMSDLEIRRWLRVAQHAADVEEVRSARRKLNNVLAYASFYLPRGFLKLGEYDRAIVSLGIAMEIEPADSELEYQLARCYAGKRDRQRAMGHLRSALARGLEGTDRLVEDELFAWLRTDPEFQSLLGPS